MSYHGYLSFLKQHLQKLDHSPLLLEVGVDRGVTFLTLVTYLSRTRQEFAAFGVDVMVQEQVQVMLDNIDRQQNQQAFLLQANSLELLPKMVDQRMKFDIVLLDGDHNYHTVSQEMPMVEQLIRDDGIVLVDDYDGRWSERDLFYSERDGYGVIAGVTSRVETEKHGVKPAVDEWLSTRPQWHKQKLMQGEPVLLSRVPI